MKKLGLSLLAICCSFVLANQVNAQCCNTGCYHDQSIDTCKEYRASGNCVCTCPMKKYRRVDYCTTKYYQEPYTVTKQCCTQVPQYYEKTNVRYVPEYYKTTHCRMVPQPYCVNETRYRTKSYCEKHCYYQPYIVYRTFTQPVCGEEPAPACGSSDCGCGSDCGCPVDCGCAPVCAPCGAAPSCNMNNAPAAPAAK